MIELSKSSGTSLKIIQGFFLCACTAESKSALVSELDQARVGFAPIKNQSLQLRPCETTFYGVGLPLGTRASRPSGFTSFTSFCIFTIAEENVTQFSFPAAFDAVSFSLSCTLCNENHMLCVLRCAFACMLGQCFLEIMRL